MSQVSKLIYHEIIGLIPNIHKIKPFKKTRLKTYCNADVLLIVLKSELDEIDLILTQYAVQNSNLVPSPTMEIIIRPSLRNAEIVVYQDRNISYRKISDKGSDPEQQATVNRLVYEWLKDLKFYKIEAKSLALL